MTILEKAIAAARLPFWLGCLVFAMAGGAPGSFLAFYLGTHSLTEAWSKTVSTSFLAVFSSNPQVPSLEAVVASILLTLSLFLDMYLVRYLRHKLLQAEPELAALAADGEAGYARSFRVMGGAGGIAFFAIIFFILYFPPRAQIATDPVSFSGMVAVTIIACAVYGTAFWTYLSGLWGVYRFGRERLILTPFYEDRLLGLRPLGQVVITFALIFSLAITVTLGGSLVVGEADSIAINLGIVALGVVMLFLPLRGIHSMMVRVKDKERASLSSRGRELRAQLAYEEQGGHPSFSRIQQLLEIQRFQLLKTEASNISEWPYEAGSVERLVAVLLAILGVLLGRLLELVH